MPKKKQKKKRKVRDKFRFVFYHSHKSEKQPYGWRVVSCNGNIVCSAEMYVAQHSARNVVKNLVAAIQSGQFRVEEDLNFE